MLEDVDFSTMLAWVCCADSEQAYEIWETDFLARKPEQSYELWRDRYLLGHPEIEQAQIVESKLVAAHEMMLRNYYLLDNPFAAWWNTPLGQFNKGCILLLHRNWGLAFRRLWLWLVRFSHA